MACLILAYLGVRWYCKNVTPLDYTGSLQEYDRFWC